MTNRFILTILLEVFMTYKVNLINSSNQSQLTNTFIVPNLGEKPRTCSASFQDI